MVMKNYPHYINYIISDDHMFIVPLSFSKFSEYAIHMVFSGLQGTTYIDRYNSANMNPERNKYV